MQPPKNTILDITENQMILSYISQLGVSLKYLKFDIKKLMYSFFPIKSRIKVSLFELLSHKKKMREYKK